MKILYLYLLLLAFSTPSALLFNAVKRDSLAFIVNAPILGASTILIMYSWMLALNVSFSAASFTILSVVAATTIKVLLDYSKELSRFSLKRDLEMLSLLALSFVACLLPFSLVDSEDLFRFRLGIDIPLYIDAAQSIIDSGRMDPKTPFAMGALNVHLRWGLPIIFSWAAFFCGEVNTTTVALSLLSIVYAIFAQSVYLYCRRSLLLSQVEAVTVCLFILFNVNVINIIAEGQWAHFFSLPFILMVFYFIGPAARDKIVTNSSVIFVSIYLSAVLVIYSEVFPFIIFTLLCSCCLSVVGSHRSDYGWEKVLYRFVMVLVIAVALVAPYSFKVIPHLISLNIKSAGYNLAHFAMPHEVLSLASIYSDVDQWLVPEVSVKPLPREGKVFGVVLSIVLVAICCLGAILRDRFVGPSIVMVFIASGLYLHLETGRSYTWMKIFVTIIPFLVAYAYCGVRSIGMNRITIYLAVIYLVISIFNCYCYIKDFKSTSVPLNEGIIYLSQRIGDHQCNISTDRWGSANGEMRWQDRTFAYMLTSVFRSQPIIDDWTKASIDGRALVASGYSCYFVDLKKELLTSCNSSISSGRYSLIIKEDEPTGPSSYSEALNKYCFKKE